MGSKRRYHLPVYAALRRSHPVALFTRLSKEETNDNGECRIKYNNELYTLYRESDTVTYSNINRLKWAGHVIRMEEQRESATRRVLVAVVEGRRQMGRSKLRWENGVMGDGVMGDGVMGDGVMGDGVMGDGRWCDGRWCDGRWEMV